MLHKLFTSNEGKYRLLRTIIQAVIGVIIANLDIITGSFILDPVYKPIITGVIMAILSPVMKALGGDENVN